MNPIAPPQLQPLAQGVVPPNPVANVVASPGTDNEEVNSAIDSSTRFKTARDEQNPQKLKVLAKDLGHDTPEGKAVNHTANVIENNQNQFDSIVNKIDNKGGIQTPEGRLAAADSFKNGEYEHSILKAVTQHLLGDKNARFYVSEGVPETKILYSKIDGTPMQVKQLPSGRVVEAFDLQNQKYLNQKEFYSMGGMPDLKDTMSYIKDKEMYPKYAEEFANNNIRDSQWAAIAPATKELLAENEQYLHQLAGKNLTNEQRQFLASISSASVGVNQSTQKGFNDFDQYIKNKGEHVDKSVTEGFKASLSLIGEKLGIPGLSPSVGGEYLAQDSKGNKYSTNDLKNLQNTFSNNNSYENNFSRNKEALEKSEVYKNLGYKEKFAIDSIMQNNLNIERKHNELIQKYGLPSFVLPTQSANITDNFARSMNKTVKGQFNADALQAFSAWKSKQLENYPAGTVPRPDELEAAFEKTPQYQGLKNFYMNKMKSIDFDKLAAPAPSNVANTPGELGLAVPPQQMIKNNQAKPQEPPTKKGEREDLIRELAKKFGAKVK
jgi:hypothetical protein